MIEFWSWGKLVVVWKNIYVKPISNYAKWRWIKVSLWFDNWTQTRNAGSCSMIGKWWQSAGQEVVIIPASSRWEETIVFEPREPAGTEKESRSDWWRSNKILAIIWFFLIANHEGGTGSMSSKEARDDSRMISVEWDANAKSWWNRGVYKMLRYFFNEGQKITYIR